MGAARRDDGRRVMRWACVLMLAGCGGSVVHAPRQRIDDAGAEPRRLLRVLPALHTTDAFDMTAKRRVSWRTIDTTLRARSNLADYPSLKVGGRGEVIAIDERGTRTVELRFDSVTLLDDQVDQRVRRPPPKLETMRLCVTPTGKIDCGALTGPLRRMSDFSVELPPDAVGVGAKWTHEDAPTIDNIRWRRRATYQLRELTDAAATIDVNMTMTAESQALHVEPNATTRLTSGTGTMTGSMTVRFDRPIVASDLYSSLEMNVLVVRGRARGSSSVTMESWLRVETRD